MSICAAPAACVRGRGATTRGTQARSWRRCSPAARWTPAEIRVGDVAGFVGGLTGRYQPRTVELAASALRSFFRFLRAEGLRADRLEDAVPMVPHRPSGLVRHLDPRDLRAADRLAGLLLAARAAGPGDHLVHGPAGAAGQRSRAAAAGRPRLAQRRRAGARPQDRSRCAAAADRRGGSGAGRATCSTAARTPRRVRCSCCTGCGPARRSAPASSAAPWTTRCGVRGWTRRSAGRTCCGIRWPPICSATAPACVEIADLLGHASLATTRIYAAVDVAALREVALPWPQATS